MIKKKQFRRKYIFAAVTLLLLITASLVFIYFTQKQKPDPASEAVIRAEAAAQLYKDPNELTDDDFAQFTEFSFGISRTIGQPRRIEGSGRNAKVIVRELSDISLFEKFTNLQRLTLANIGYTDKNIPKWIKLMARFGFLDLADRFSIDLSPLEELEYLNSVGFYMVPLNNIEPLSSITNLRNLSLEYTEVRSLEPLRGLTNINVLVIMNTPISDLEPIKDLVNLKTLILNNTEVSNFEPLKRLKGLRRLDILHSSICDLEPLKALTELESLSLRYSENITNEQVEDLQKALPNLRIER